MTTFRVLGRLLVTALLIGTFAAVFRALWIEQGGGVVDVVRLALAYGVLTLACVVVFGLPASWVIRRFGLRAAWQVIGLGAALGALCGVLLPVLLGDSRARQFASGLYPYPVEYALFGAVAGFAGWWWLLRRPG